MAVAFAAAVANAFAAVLQAGAAREIPPRGPVRFSLLGRLARRPRWVLGTVLLMLAWPLQVLALTLAPLTLVQPVLASFPVVVLVFAHWHLHERVGRSETLGALSITAGVIVIVLEAPRHTDVTQLGLRLALPLVAVGAAALVAFAGSRRPSSHGLELIIGAGLGYAWVDFVDKLLSNAVSSSHWMQAALWLVAILAFGAVAFLQENGAFQRRPAVQVGPVISAIQDPLPVLMALWAGVETWGADAGHIILLVVGLAFVVAGAFAVGRSKTVVNLTAAPEANLTAAPEANLTAAPEASAA
jgi:drug/metabolite transporter (DMT)-like permease